MENSDTNQAPQLREDAVSTSFPLIPMSDFVLSKDKCDEEIENIYDFHEVVIKYAKFLKQPLELRMFVPCDEKGNILEFPNRVDDYWRDANGLTDDFYEEINRFNKAKERCLFEGFIYKPFGYATYKYNDDGECLEVDEDYCENRTIETIIIYALRLSKSAISELNINVV